MPDNVIQPSFSAGELSPHLYGRVDLAKYHVGAALLWNYFVDYRGGAARYPGTKFVAAAGSNTDPVRIISFQYSTEQTYILEFGPLYMRVFKNGAQVLTGGGSTYSLVTPYAAADLALLKFSQSADTMTITHPDYAPRDLVRVADNDWTLTVTTFAAVIGSPAISANTVTGGDTTYTMNYSYVVTALGASGEESLPSVASTSSGPNIALKPGTIELKWAAPVGAARYNVYKANPSVSGKAIPSGARYGYMLSAEGTTALDTHIIPDFTKSPPTHANPFAVGVITEVTLTAGGTGYGSPPTVSISDPSGTGAVVEALLSGDVVSGFILKAGGSGYTAPTVTITPTSGGSGASATATAGPTTGTYPGVSSYFQQRRVYAASRNVPHGYWMSQSGLFHNFDVTNPVVDSDAITGALTGLQVNAIKSLVPMPGGLVAFTAGGAWQISGAAGADSPITPSSISAKPQAYRGASDLPPIVITTNILFVQAKDSRVQELSYNFLSQGYASEDKTIFASHLFHGHTVVSWAYAEEPFKQVWLALEDGSALTMTYVKDQQLEGWSRRYTQGQIKSIAVASEGGEDVVYFVVKRFIGNQWWQYIERQASLTFSNLEDGWFVDCGLSYLPALGTTTIQGFAIDGSEDWTLQASVATFVAGDVGKIFRGAGGRATVAQYIDAQTVRVTPDLPFLQTVPETEDSMTIPLIAGTWSFGAEVTTVSGLDHLGGETVQVLADGVQLPDAVVPTDGVLSLVDAAGASVSASRVIVGLPYRAKFQTLRLEPAGGGTTQGKRKKISAATIRVNNTRGLRAGTTFDTLATVLDPASGLYSGDLRVVLDPSFNQEGQICIQQDGPFPSTIIAIVPEVSVGDA